MCVNVNLCGIPGIREKDLKRVAQNNGMGWGARLRMCMGNSWV